MYLNKKINKLVYSKYKDAYAFQILAPIEKNHFM